MIIFRIVILTWKLLLTEVSGSTEKSPEEGKGRKEFGLLVILIIVIIIQSLDDHPDHYFHHLGGSGEGRACTVTSPTSRPRQT